MNRKRAGRESERGQILVVTAGTGWVCTHGESPQPLTVGDVVWVPPGERHWHGAGPDTIMTHLATSLGTSRSIVSALVDIRLPHALTGLTCG